MTCRISLLIIISCGIKDSEFCTPPVQPRPSPAPPEFGSTPPFVEISTVLRTVLGGTVNVDGRIKTTGGDLVRHPEQLDCYDFGAECKWRNPKSQKLEWMRATGSPDGNRLLAVAGTSQLPNHPFAISLSTSALAEDQGAVLTSDPIPCQQSDGELRIRYWMSPLTQLSVCTKRLGRSRFDYCSPVIVTGSPGPAYINIPGPILNTFEIYIQANNFAYKNGQFQGGFVMIDNVQYIAELCDYRETNDFGRAKISKEVTEPVPFKNDEIMACNILKCSFHTGPCVDYIFGSGWRIKKGPVGNPLTGIRGDASFLPFNPNGTYAFAVGPAGTIRFESPPFYLPMTRNLEFYYYKASAETQFEIFAKRHGHRQKSIFRAPNVNRDSRQWLRELRQLLAGTYEKLIFEAGNLRTNTIVGLDEIRLVGNKNQPLC